jgi:hypothetical protein
LSIFSIFSFSSVRGVRRPVLFSIQDPLDFGGQGLIAPEQFGHLVELIRDFQRTLRVAPNHFARERPDRDPSERQTNDRIAVNPIDRIVGLAQHGFDLFGHGGPSIANCGGRCLCHVSILSGGAPASAGAFHSGYRDFGHTSFDSVYG